MSASQRKTVLMPEYMRNFHCIGSGCEDNCCVDTTDIDKESFLEFNSIKDTQLKDKVKNHIVRNPSGKHYSYARINMKKGQKCHFLNSENKCELQINLGAEHLACTCYTVPRTLNLICGIYEMSCRLLCPEAARLALLDSKIMGFDQIGMDLSPRYLITSDTNRKDAESIQQNWFDIRSTVINILQYRKIDFSDRLAICGLFIKRVDDENKKKNIVKDLPGLIENYRHIYQNSDTVSKIAETRSASDNAISRFMKILFDVLIQNTRNSNGAQYQEMVSHIMDISGYKDGRSYDRVIQNLREARELFYDPYMKDRQYIYENYFVNLVFQRLFPLRDIRSVFSEFFIYPFYYFAMKCLLIGVSSCHKKLDDDLVISLIHNLSRIIDCRIDIEGLLNELFFKEKLTSIENFTLLSKF